MSRLRWDISLVIRIERMIWLAGGVKTVCVTLDSNVPPPVLNKFSSFEGRLGILKDPLEVIVEDKTCTTIHGTHLEGILSQKNWTGLAGGGQKRSFFGQNMASEASLGP